MSVKGGVPSLYSTILLNQPKVQEEKVTLYFLSFFLVYTLLFVPSQRRSSPFFPSCFLPFMLSSPVSSLLLGLVHLLSFSALTAQGAKQHPSQQEELKAEAVRRVACSLLFHKVCRANAVTLVWR
jgi:hypothetical protein